MSNRYRKTINDNTYYVSVHSGYWYTTVRIRKWSQGRTLLKRREWFCEDDERLAAKTLNEAVQRREKQIAESNQYDERIERALDVVQDEYDN